MRQRGPTPAQRFRLILLGLGLVLLLALLWMSPWAAGSSVPEAKAAPAADAEAGRLVYEERCAPCHGLDGDGNGPAARLLSPRPRDFRRGLYKVRTTGSGALPTNEDLFRTISRGMPGTTMPGWAEQLQEQQRRDVVEYIKTFSRRFARGESPEPIALGKPIPASAESIAKGRELYFGPLECFKCHGQQGRGDGPSALELEDDYGFPIVPANLTKSWNFRGGSGPANIARTFLTGLLGTPMPSYEGQMTEEQAWHLANFVHSLAPPQRPEVKALLTARRVEGSLPATVDDPRWSQREPFFVPLVGQIMREPRNFTPALDSITVRALYNDEELALLLTWDDRSEDRVAAGTKTVDVVAVQFPAELTEGFARPYFLEGDPAHPVNLWGWRADARDVQELSAAGLGTARPQNPESQALAGEAVYGDGQWRLLLRRSLTTQDTRNDIQFELGRFTPVAFSAWDGYSGEEGGRRALSTWYLLYLERPTPLSSWLQVPGRVAAVGVAEGLVLWWARRRQTVPI